MHAQAGTQAHMSNCHLHAAAGASMHAQAGTQQHVSSSQLHAAAGAYTHAQAGTQAHASSSQWQAAAGASIHALATQAHASSSQRQAAAGASMRVLDAQAHAPSSQRQAAAGASKRVSNAQPRSSCIGGGVQAALRPSAARPQRAATNRAPSAIPALDVFMHTGTGYQTEGLEAAAPAPAVMHGSRQRSPVPAVSPGPGMQRAQTGCGRVQALGASAGGLAPGLSAEQQAPKVRCFV